MAVDYKAWLTEARAELKVLQREKAEVDARKIDLDSRVAALAKTISALTPLVEGSDSPREPQVIEAFAQIAQGLEADRLGMTDKVRAVLQVAKEPLAPTDVRDQLQVAGFDLSSYSNALAMIHTVLKRLASSGTIEITADGKKYLLTAARTAKTAPRQISRKAKRHP